MDEKVVNYNRNPVGRGGFRDRPWDINKAGSPKKIDELSNSGQQVLNMTIADAIEHFGKESKWGKRLAQLAKGLSPEVKLIELVNAEHIIAMAEKPDSKIYTAVGDRTYGKPVVSIDMNSKEDAIITIGVDTDKI